MTKPIHILSTKEYLVVSVRSRAAAKSFIYALCSWEQDLEIGSNLNVQKPNAREALDLFLRRYTGWERLKEETIAKDA